MSTGLYSHTTRATGTILTAAIYNADHVNHITNANPSMIGGYSDDVAEMQTQTDPGELGSESLAGSLAGELERIRFVIAALAGETFWYDASAITFAGNPLTADLDFDGNNADNVGVMFLIEQAAADADVAGSGQFWVETATPNVPKFTDDAGNDATLLRNIDALTFDEYVFIEAPEDKDYRVIINSSFARTITEITTRSESGTCTLTGKINATPLGGTANAVSSTEQSQAHASANVVAAGDDIVLTVSANAACLGMSVKIKYTRVLS